MRAAAVVLVLLAGQEAKDPPWVVPPKKPIELLQHKTFRSASMGVDVGYHLYLPPGYAEDKDRRYPVIYWHHGMNCHESNDQFPPSIVDRAIREGKVPPLIVVYPNGGGRSFYCDSVDGGVRSETMIVTELIPHIDATCRTVATREGRALQGMSMGGFGVLKLAFKHPELYSSVVAFAGGLIDADQLEQRHPELLKRMFGGDKAKFAAETPMALAREKAATIKLPIKMLVGTKDFLLEHNRRMHAVLEELKIPHEYEEIPDVAHNLPALAKHLDTRGLEFAFGKRDVLDLAGRKATVRRIDALPFVESDYTKRFTFDVHGNPNLQSLREAQKLDEVVAAGKDEFDRQILLLDWAHQKFKKFGRPTSDARGALDILKAVDEGHTFFCAHYAEVLVSASASLGWVDRALALRRHQGSAKGGSTEHTSTEIWSNQHRKWVMLDPTANLYVEKDGVPLNAVEIRTEWFYRDGKDLVFSIGKERKKYRKADLPVLLGRFEGFGDLKLETDEMDKYGFTGFIPNTNLMDAGSDYGKMFIVKDKLCDGTSWHTRTVPANPAVDPYFPIGQAALTLAPDGGKIRVSLKTLTPNFLEFRVRVDGGEWTSTSDAYAWAPRPGANRLEAKAVNRFGVDGPVSSVVLDVE